MCLATDIPKRSGTQKKKNNALNGNHCTDFWLTLDELWPLNEHRTICFLLHISNNCIIKKDYKTFQQNLTSSVTSSESSY